MGSSSAFRISPTNDHTTALKFNGLLYVLGSLFLTFAIDPYTMIAGRLIAGGACGLALSLTPISLREMAQGSRRHSIGVMTQISICSGILLTQATSWYFDRTGQWRWIFSLGIILGGLQFLLLPGSRGSANG